MKDFNFGIKKRIIRYRNTIEKLENELRRKSNPYMRKLIKSGKFEEAKKYLGKFYRGMECPAVKVLQFKEIIFAEKEWIKAKKK